ncbi:hypothetical protein C8F01DRAFT_1090619 [Mycena amicta]|nr:hypothetical protein C8F01DRAFT_1090619 [Mycena amicta]
MHPKPPGIEIRGREASLVKEKSDIQGMRLPKSRVGGSIFIGTADSESSMEQYQTNNASIAAAGHRCGDETATRALRSDGEGRDMRSSVVKDARNVSGQKKGASKVLGGCTRGLALGATKSQPEACAVESNITPVQWSANQSRRLRTAQIAQVAHNQASMHKEHSGYIKCTNERAATKHIEQGAFEEKKSSGRISINPNEFAAIPGQTSRKEKVLERGSLQGRGIASGKARAVTVFLDALTQARLGPTKVGIGEKTQSMRRTGTSGLDRGKFRDTRDKADSHRDVSVASEQITAKERYREVGRGIRTESSGTEASAGWKSATAVSRYDKSGGAEEYQEGGARTRVQRTVGKDSCANIAQKSIEKESYTNAGAEDDRGNTNAQRSAMAIGKDSCANGGAVEYWESYKGSYANAGAAEHREKAVHEHGCRRPSANTRAQAWNHSGKGRARTQAQRTIGKTRTRTQAQRSIGDSCTLSTGAEEYQSEGADGAGFLEAAHA